MRKNEGQEGDTQELEDKGRVRTFLVGRRDKNLRESEDRDRRGRVGPALEALTRTVACLEGSRRGHERKTLVVGVVVVVVRLHCFSAMTGSGCASHVPPDDQRDAICLPARSHDDDEPVRGVLTCGPCGRITAALSFPVFITEICKTSFT